MRAFIRRLFGYLCFSLFLAALLGPFTGNRMEQEAQPVLFLSAVALHSRAPVSAAATPPPDLTPVALRPFPEIKRAVTSLKGPPVTKSELTLPANRIDRFIQTISGTEKKQFCFRYENGTFLVERSAFFRMGSVRLVGLAAPPSGMPVIPKGEMASYPGLNRYLRSLDRIYSPTPALHRLERTATPISENEWRDLAQTLDLAAASMSFQAGDFLIIGDMQQEIQSVPVPIPWFKPLRFAAAGLFFLTGIWFMWGIYQRLPGINLNPGWSARIGDGLFILFLSFCAYCLMEFGLVGLGGMIPFLDDDAVIAVSSLGYLPAAAFFSFFATMLFRQSVEISREGIAIVYPGRVETVPWETVEGLALKNSYTVVGRAGMLVPSKLQTKLLIHTRKAAFSLVEPGTGETKRRIVHLFKEHAPARLQPDVNRLASQW